jgi:hypothetical protein
MRATCLAGIVVIFLDLLIRIILGMEWFNVAEDRDSGRQLCEYSGFVNCEEFLDHLRNC